MSLGDKNETPAGLLQYVKPHPEYIQGVKW